MNPLRHLLCLGLGLLITGCAVGSVDIEQEQASGLASELVEGHTFGQTFTPHSDGLYRIDLYTATYARENTHAVIFRIQAEPGAAQDLVHVELTPAQISNSGPTVITFAPLAETAGKTLYFSIESPGSAPGNAFTIYRNEKDVYPDGQMFVDGQPTPGDIAFIAYTRETFTPADIWNDFYSRASQDQPFFIFYCSLLTVLLLGLVVTLVWPRRSKPAASPPDSTDDAKSLPEQTEKGAE